MNEVNIISSAGSVSCDFDTIRNYLNTQLDYYKHIVFTEETKKDAKKTVAELRKEQKAFDNRIKEVKAEYMKPFDEFKAKADELVDMFDEPINYINKQIEAFEDKRKAEKKLLIAEIYEELVPESDLKEFIPLGKIFNPKWENATTTEKAIRSEIMELKIATKTAIETIKGMHSDVEAIALDMYKSSFDLPTCINHINMHEQKKKEILEREQERIKREEEERIRREEREKIELEQKHKVELAEAKAQFVEDLIPVYDGLKKTTISYFVKVSPSEKEALELYMNSIGIEFEEMPM